MHQARLPQVTLYCTNEHLTKFSLPFNIISSKSFILVDMSMNQANDNLNSLEPDQAGWSKRVGAKPCHFWIFL